MQYRKLIHSVNGNDEAFGCFCLSLKVDDDVVLRFSDGTHALKEESVSMKEWYGVKSLEALQDILHAPRANHVIAPLRNAFYGHSIFYLKRFYYACYVCIVKCIFYNI